MKTHAEIVEAPVMFENLPDWHSWHIATDLAEVMVENVLTWQSRHTVAKICEYLPGTQLIHAVASVTESAYVPAEHQ